MWQVGFTSEGFRYYTNALTGESTWERPEGFVGDEQPEADAVDVSVGGAADASHAAAVAAGDAATGSVVDGGKWVLAADKKGNPFYYDAATGESRWAQPEDWVEQGASGAACVPCSMSRPRCLPEAALRWPSPL